MSDPTTTRPVGDRRSRPLTGSAADGLIPTFAATWADVDLAEQANIETATRWAFAGRRVATVERLLTAEFSDRVHREMFGSVWRWAGQYRTESIPECAPPEEIPSLLPTIFDTARERHARARKDARHRAEQLYDELLYVRAYRTGAGRHARFMANLYLHLCDEPRIDWDDPTAGPDATPAGGLSALEQALDRLTEPARLTSTLDRSTSRQS